MSFRAREYPFAARSVAGPGEDAAGVARRVGHDDRLMCEDMGRLGAVGLRLHGTLPAPAAKAAAQ